MTWRRAARIALGALMLGSGAVTVWTGAHLLRDWPAATLVDRTEAELAAAFERALGRYGTPANVSARYAELLEQEPRNWLAIESVEGIATHRGIDFPAEITARRQGLYDRDHGVIATSAACAACAWDPKACDFSAILICRAPVDLTPIGDVAGILREGANITTGRDVDEVDLALSVVGLAAVVLAPVTLGNSATIKVGAGMGKTAWRMGRLSEGLATPLRRAAREGVEWNRLAGIRPFSAQAGDDLAGLLNRAALQPALDLAADAGRMHGALGARATLYMLSRADTPTEARRFANASGALQNQSIGALEVLGKSRFLRTTMRWSEQAIFAILGLIGFVGALTALCWNLIASMMLRTLRRLAR